MSHKEKIRTASFSASEKRQTEFHCTRHFSENGTASFSTLLCVSYFERFARVALDETFPGSILQIGSPGGSWVHRGSPLSASYYAEATCPCGCAARVSWWTK